ncbi:MAG: hypothetical protein MR368_03470 [Azospirillum sp.]|nr:hypothetical protein [Azospirillum sp.]
MSDYDLDETLQKMGASWYVSYDYYKHFDSTHANWSKVGTAGRQNRYDNSSIMDRIYWLEIILNKNENKLDNNHIYLSGREIKSMARMLLNFYKKELENIKQAMI